jgi:hypothetical protein
MAKEADLPGEGQTVVAADCGASGCLQGVTPYITSLIEQMLFYTFPGVCGCFDATSTGCYIWLHSVTLRYIFFGIVV